MDPNLQREGDPPPNHVEALKITKAEICPHRSLLKIGENIADKILSFYDSAISVAIEFVLRKDFAHTPFLTPSFQVSKRKSLGDNTEMRPRDREICEYRCNSSVFITITAGAEKRMTTLVIETKEIPRPSTSGNERLGEVIQGKEISKNSLSQPLPIESVYPMFGVLRTILESVIERSYPDVQALGLDIANMAFQGADKLNTCNNLREITVRGIPHNPKLGLHKIKRTLVDQCANRYAKHEPFFIRLQRSEYEKSKHATNENKPANLTHLVYIALGSNVGDRLSMIESACHEMGCRGINVVRTSGLYETEPMYVEEQQLFINGACEVCKILT